MLYTNKNELSLFFDKLLGMITVGIFSFILAKFMLVDHYAQWSIIATYTSLIGLFAKGGLDTHILVSSTRISKENTIPFIQLKLMMLFPVAIAVTVFLIKTLDNLSISHLILFMFSNSILSLETVEIKFKATRRFYWIFERKFRFKIFGFILKLILFLYFRSLNSIFIGFALEYSMYLLFFSKYAELNKIYKDVWLGVRKVWNIELTYLIASSIVVWLYMRFAFLFISRVGSVEDIAQFYLSNKVIEMFLVLPPVLVVDRIRDLENGQYKILVYNGLKLMLVVLFIYLFAGLLPMIFGPSFENVDTLVRIMIWVLPIVYFGEIIEKTYVFKGRKFAVLLRGIIGVIFGSVYIYFMTDYSIYSFAYLVLFLQAATNLFYPLLNILWRHVRFSLR